MGPIKVSAQPAMPANPEPKANVKLSTRRGGHAQAGGHLPVLHHPRASGAPSLERYIYQ